jgi:archaemetzincin
VLGLTTSDLWPGEGWNFVFGQASLSDRVGVWSIARYGNLENPQMSGLVYRRTFLVAVHETGHMLGIQHCTAYECTMNGSNSLDEADRAPMWLCPECVQKVWWACHADPIKRYKSLVEFAKEHDLKAEAGFWQKSLERLSANDTGKEPADSHPPLGGNESAN